MKQSIWTFRPTDTHELKGIYIKKFHSFALYALMAPAITFGATSVLAQQSADQQTQGTPGYQSDGSLESPPAANRLSISNQSRKGYLSGIPTNGMHASDLLSAKVKTTDDKDIGSVKDLTIDKNGQVVAIVVGAGGFLGMGEKDVAIGWDHITRSGTLDKQKLQVNVSRDDLLAAPEFEKKK